MRKTIFAILSLLAIIGFMPKEEQTNYTYVPAVITQDGSELLCTDNPLYDGNVYEFSDLRFQSGDEVTVIFDDNETPEDITDDIILQIIKEV